MSYTRNRSFSKPDVTQSTASSGSDAQTTANTQPSWWGKLMPETAQSNVNVLTQRFTKTVSDNVTPDFYKLKKQGAVLPVNDFLSDTLKLVVTGNLQMVERWAGYKYQAPPYLPAWWSGNAHVPYPTPIATINHSGKADDQPTEAYFVNRAIANARGQLFDLGTFLAEFHQVRDLFTKTVREVGDLLDRARVAVKYLSWGTPGSGYATARVAADAYLSAKYGAVLTARDLKELYDLLQLLLVSSRTSRIRGRHEYHHETTTSGTVVNSKRVYRYAKTSVRDITGFAVLESQLATLGVSLDVLSTWYEVLPISFVIDWLVDYGGILAAVSPFGVGEVKASGITFVQRTTAQVTIDAVASAAARSYGTTKPDIYSITAPVCNLERVTIKRYPYGPAITYPPVNFPKGFGEYATIIAIATQLAGKYLRFLR